ncbi:MAG: DUF739 family protein [Bacteroidales bacterium]|nr:DUF739 family protein [Candidatus Scybalousia scybalohippi]
MDKTEDMTFNYRKLKGRIIEIFGNQENFASEIGISTNALSRKLNNKIALSQSDIVTWASKLNVADDEYKDFFFMPK